MYQSVFNSTCRTDAKHCKQLVGGRKKTIRNFKCASDHSCFAVENKLSILLNIISFMRSANRTSWQATSGSPFLNSIQSLLSSRSILSGNIVSQLYNAVHRTVWRNNQKNPKKRGQPLQKWQNFNMLKCSKSFLQSKTQNPGNSILELNFRKHLHFSRVSPIGVCINPHITPLLHCVTFRISLFSSLSLCWALIVVGSGNATRFNT